MTSLNTTVPPVRWLEAQWIDSDFCLGPPSSLFLFDTFSPLDTPNYYEKSDFSYLSPIYDELNFHLPYPYSYCANTRFVSQLPVDTFCCVSSVNLEFSHGIQSAVDILTNSTVDDVLNFDYLLYTFSPASSNGNTYCSLATPDSINNLYGFNAIYVLNDGHCMESKKNNMSITCSRDGLLSLYFTSNCTLDRIDMQLGYDATEALLPTWGQFSAKMISLNNSTSKPGWTTFRPYSKLRIPNWRHSLTAIRHPSIYRRSCPNI